MVKLDVPFNIELLRMAPEVLKVIKPTTSLDIYEGMTRNFHPEGLYSTQIFGSKGSEARFRNYSYIDLKIQVFYPVIYNALVALKGLYADIMSGREFAVFDEEIKDFVRSNALDGQTGFQFFVDNWKKIVFEQRKSTTREQNIKLVESHRENAMERMVFVIPAGYRDIEIDANGRESSDELNSLYYKLIAISNTVNAQTAELAPQAYNQQRNALQNTRNEIFESLLKIIEGKNNLIMGKWASRKVFNGTRNVITAMDTRVAVLGDGGNPTFNDTFIGLFQFAKAILPVARFKLKQGFLSKVFSDVGAPALLCDPKTMQSTRVSLKSDAYDRWMTNEGLESIINSYKEPSIRDQPIMVDGHYLGLCYRGPDNTFKLISGVDQLPQGRSAEHCTPITLIELLYCTLYDDAHKHPILVTRYPIASDRSTYPSKAYLKSTIRSERRVELDDDWRPYGNDKRMAYQFPVIGSDTYNSLSPHSSRLAGLGGD